MPKRTRENPGDAPWLLSPSNEQERERQRAAWRDEMPEPHDFAECAPYVFGEPERETRTGRVNS